MIQKLETLIFLVQSPRVFLRVMEGRFQRFCRGIFEKVGIERLSKPYGVGEMSNHVRFMKHLNFRGGFFIEIGGYDGFFHSPTYYLERFRGWDGVLIEPVKSRANRCAKERHKSKVYNYVCTRNAENGDVVEIQNCAHSSHVLNHGIGPENWVQEIQSNISPHEHVLQVPAIRLSDLLDIHFKKYGIREIDLLVLDVEGFELEVLGGVEFERHRPRYILIESHTSLEFNNNRKHLELNGYTYVEKISSTDYLYSCGNQDFKRADVESSIG